MVAVGEEQTHWASPLSLSPGSLLLRRPAVSSFQHHCLPGACLEPAMPVAEVFTLAPLWPLQPGLEAECRVGAG